MFVILFSANVFPAICITALSFTRSTTLAVILLIVAMGTQAGCHTGWMVYSPFIVYIIFLLARTSFCLCSLFGNILNLSVFTIQVNYIDLAPNFTGTLIATGASLLNVFTILLPIFVSQVVTDVVSIFIFIVAFKSYAINKNIFISVFSHIFPQ